MKVEEYLKRSQDLKKIAKRKKERYKKLRDKATAAGGSIICGDYKQDTNRREDLLVKLADARTEAQRAEMDYIEAEQELFKNINTLPADEADALYFRYVQGKPIAEIRKSWKEQNGRNISQRQLFYTLNKAKKHLETLITETRPAAGSDETKTASGFKDNLF